MASALKIGIAGLGTVGIGCVKLVQQHAEMLAAKAGRPVAITAVSAMNRSKDRGADLSPYAWEDDAAALATRGDVDCVVEVIGGDLSLKSTVGEGSTFSVRLPRP